MYSFLISKKLTIIFTTYSMVTSLDVASLFLQLYSKALSDLNGGKKKIKRKRLDASTRDFTQLHSIFREFTHT